MADRRSVMEPFGGAAPGYRVCIPKGSMYHYSRYLVGILAPKVYTILVLGPFGIEFGGGWQASGVFSARRVRIFKHAAD